MKVVIEHKGRVYESANDMPDDVIQDFISCLLTYMLCKALNMFREQRKELKSYDELRKLHHRNVDGA